MKRVTIITDIRSKGFEKIPFSILAPTSSENAGRKTSTNTNASKSAAIEIIKASTMNCLISCILSAPSVFLTPTSRAHLLEREVERFMKLMQAISKMKIPMTDIIIKFLELLPGSISPLNSVFR